MTEHPCRHAHAGAGLGEEGGAWRGGGALGGPGGEGEHPGGGLEGRVCPEGAWGGGCTLGGA